jgi:hypothetical protein
VNWASGATLLLSGLLLVAGALKLVDPRPTGHALRRLTKPGSWRYPRPTPIIVARVLGGAEVAIGLALLLTSGPAREVASVLAAGLFAGFAVVVVVAIHKGVACGCFGSFSDGPAGGAEAARAVVLALIAIGLAITTPTSFTLTSSTVAAAAVLGVATVAAMLIGRAILPSKRPPAARPRGVLRTFVGGVSNDRAAFPLARPTERVAIAADEVAVRGPSLADDAVVRSVIDELHAAGASPSWADGRATRVFVRSRHGTRVISEQFVVPCEPAGQLDFTRFMETGRFIAFGQTPTGDRITLR